MGVLSAFDLIATARSQGLDLTERDGKLRVTGPKDAGDELVTQMRARRDDILEALSHSSRICATCGDHQVDIISWSGEPFCRPCAQRVGTELLAEEAPWILERPVPTLRINPPPAPQGCVADLAGNFWALTCRCGHHPNGKGHDAQPVNHLIPAEEAS